jgi:hypothetical protein
MSAIVPKKKDKESCEVSKPEPSYTRDHPSRGPGEYKWNRGESKLIEIILKFVSDRVGYASLRISVNP